MGIEEGAESRANIASFIIGILSLSSLIGSLILLFYLLSI
jgi:hypothetical protein